MQKVQQEVFVAIATAWHSAARDLAPLLDARDRFRAERLVRADDRDAFVVAHALQRQLLERMAFRRTNSDHSACETDPSPRTSLSHTQGLAACAIIYGNDVGYGNGVGVDAEKIVFDLDWAAVGRTAFAKSEQKILKTSICPVETFHRIWTIREAALKALGVGFAARPDDLVVAIDPPSVLLPLPGRGLAWRVEEFGELPDYRLAVVFRHLAGTTPRVKWMTVNLAD